ncbi:putative non-specific serine/threonine protein kinase [Helianthus annuus]|nr:putative non-specific serine/threonine protein kinase [Helianthus annuus]KAJ0633069.1 putative non-specific serine/threonine protein kinase [Helianthus annuus]
MFGCQNPKPNIDLSMNNFTGNLENFHTCGKSLQELYVDSNSFSGDISEFIYSFSSLKRLSLSSNNFSGELSTNLGNLSNLQSLVLFGNLAGPLPNVFKNLTHLEELTAHTNSFSGPLLPPLKHVQIYEFLIFVTIRYRVILNIAKNLDLEDDGEGGWCWDEEEVGGDLGGAHLSLNLFLNVLFISF